MEEIVIIYKSDVELYLNDLTFILFKKDYFSYFENSVIYKNKIIEFIEESIETFPPKKTPKELKNFGQNYIFYKSNQRTTWYIFFELMKNNYLITNIINSNSEEVKFL